MFNISKLAKSKNFAFSIIALAVLMSALDQTIVATALPIIAVELKNFNHMTWVIISYLIASTATMPLYGRLSTMFRRKHILSASVFLFTLGSLLAALSTNFNFLIASRAIQGIGGGGMFVLAFTIMGDMFPPRELGKYQGYIATMFAIGSIAGPIIGGFFAEHLDWRWCFWINIPIGLLVIAMSKAIKTSYVKVDRKFGMGASILLVISIVSMLFFIENIKNFDNLDMPLVFSLAGVFILSIILIIFVERDSKDPVIPMNLFRNSVYSLSLLIMFLTSLTFLSIVIFIPIELQFTKSISASMSGLILMSYVAITPISAFIAGRQIRKTGKYKIFIVAGTVLLLLSLVLLSIFNSRDVLSVSIILVLAGFGTGNIFPSVGIAIQNILNKKNRGIGMSFYSFVRSFGGTVGIAISSATFYFFITSKLDQSAGSKLLSFINSQGKSTANNILATNSNVIEVLKGAFSAVYASIIIFMFTALILSLFLKQYELKQD